MNRQYIETKTIKQRHSQLQSDLEDHKNQLLGAHGRIAEHTQWIGDLKGRYQTIEDIQASRTKIPTHRARTLPSDYRSSDDDGSDPNTDYETVIRRLRELELDLHVGVKLDSAGCSGVNAGSTPLSSDEQQKINGDIQDCRAKVAALAQGIESMFNSLVEVLGMVDEVLENHCIEFERIKGDMRGSYTEVAALRQDIDSSFNNLVELIGSVDELRKYHNADRQASKESLEVMESTVSAIFHRVDDLQSTQIRMNSRMDNMQRQNENLASRVDEDIHQHWDGVNHRMDNMERQNENLTRHVDEETRQRQRLAVHNLQERVRNQNARATR